MDTAADSLAGARSRRAVKGMRPPRAQSAAPTILWGVSAVLVLALLGFELIGRVASIQWLIFTVLVLSGAFLRVPAAMSAGGISLVLSVVWVIWRAGIGQLEVYDLFFVFLLPVAFLPLSALRASVESKNRLDRRVVNWRVMPMHQIAGVIRFLQHHSTFEFALSVEMSTSNLGFSRSLLGAHTGREQLISLQSILGELIADTGYAFLDYDKARCRLLLPDTSPALWQVRFAQVLAQRDDLAMTYSEVNRIDLAQSGPAGDEQPRPAAGNGARGPQTSGHDTVQPR